MTTDIISLTGTGAFYRFNAGAANIWISMIGSVAGVYIGSVILNGGYAKLHDITIGTIIGGVMVGTGAGFI